MEIKFLTLAEFLAEKKISREDFDKKSADEKAVLAEEHAKQFKTSLGALAKQITDEQDKKNADLVTELKGQLEAQRERYEEVRDEQLKSINNSLKEHGLALKKVLAGSGSTAKKSFSEQIRAVFSEKKDDVKTLINGSISEAKSASFSFELKGLELKDITIGGSISGGNVPVEQRLAGVNMLPRRQVRLLDILATGSALSNVISWVHEASDVGSPGGTAEAAPKNQIDIIWAVASEVVKKRTAFVKASTESIEDVDFVESQIRNKLTVRLSEDVEEQAHSGDGLAQNLNGLKTIASAFSPAPFAGAVDNANNADVLVVAMDNIMARNQPMPNFITMYPSDVTALKLTKVSSTDRRYVDRLTMIAGQLFLDGVPIIPTTLEAQDEYLIGNGSLATLFDKGAIRIDVGLAGNDFTDNMRTILAEWRGALVVETNDRSAFVAGTFSTDKAALETP